MLEFYIAYATYRDLMELIPQMLAEAARSALGTTLMRYQGHEIDLAQPYERLTITRAEEGGAEKAPCARVKI
jgi:lysyl-tRNA synthetase class 2